MAVIDPNEVMDKKTLAEKLELSERTIDRRIGCGELPEPAYLGQSPRWVGAKVLDFLEKNMNGKRATARK